jgi:hypothetical protein
LWCLLHASLVIVDKHLKLGRTLLGLINMHVQKMAYIALHNYLHMTFFFFFHVGVQASLCISRLIPRTLKLMIM